MNNMSKNFKHSEHIRLLEPMCINRGNTSTTYLDTYKNKENKIVDVCMKKIENVDENVEDIIRESFFSNGGKYLLRTEDFTQGYNCVRFFMQYGQPVQIPKIYNKHMKKVYLEHLVVDMIKGLTELHLRCIVHNDVKLDNMVIVNNRLHIIDWNIACFYGKEGLTNTNVQTYYCRSPECILEKEIEPYTYQQDIWALGATIYNLLTEKYLFEYKNWTEKELKKQLAEAKKELRQISWISDDVYKVLDATLQFDPKLRWSPQAILKVKLNKYYENLRLHEKKEKSGYSSQRIKNQCTLPDYIVALVQQILNRVIEKDKTFNITADVLNSAIYIAEILYWDSSRKYDLKMVLKITQMCFGMNLFYREKPIVYNDDTEIFIMKTIQKYIYDHDNTYKKENKVNIINKLFNFLFTKECKEFILFHKNLKNVIRIKCLEFKNEPLLKEHAEKILKMMSLPGH